MGLSILGAWSFQTRALHQGHQKVMLLTTLQALRGSPKPTVAASFKTPNNCGQVHLCTTSAIGYIT